MANQSLTLAYKYLNNGSLINSVVALYTSVFGPWFFVIIIFVIKFIMYLKMRNNNFNFTLSIVILTIITAASKFNEFFYDLYISSAFKTLIILAVFEGAIILFNIFYTKK